MTNPSADLPIKRELIQDTQALAKELNISWGRLLTLALQDFVRKYHNRKQLVNQINAAYADDGGENEKELLQTMSSTHRQIVESEW